MSLSTGWTTPVPDANAARAPKASSRKRNHLRRLLAPVDDGTNHLCKDVGYGRPARCTRTGRGRLGTGPPQGEGPSREPAGIRYLVPPHRGARTDRSEEHTSELQSRVGISYAVFCLKKKNKGRSPALRRTCRQQSASSWKRPTT